MGLPVLVRPAARSQQVWSRVPVGHVVPRWHRSERRRTGRVEELIEREAGDTVRPFEHKGVANMAVDGTWKMTISTDDIDPEIVPLRRR